MYGPPSAINPSKRLFISTAPSWADMSSDMLSLIFRRIPADDLNRSVAFVCTPWTQVVFSSYCWSNIDIEQWCRRCSDSDRIEKAVISLVKRCDDADTSCSRFSAYKLTNAGFAFLANRLKCLKVLQMPMSDVTDRMVLKHVESLKQLTSLDISYCVKITCKGLEALGKCCTSLVHLRRSMPPPEWQKDIGALASKRDDGEALVIARTMLGLCKLEVGYGCFTDLGLDAILTNCKNLTHLDIIGCYEVKLEGDLEDKCARLVMFRPPWDDDFDISGDSD